MEEMNADIKQACALCSHTWGLQLRAWQHTT